jgi:hypothetical protein
MIKASKTLQKPSIFFFAKISLRESRNPGTSEGGVVVAETLARAVAEQRQACREKGAVFRVVEREAR